MPPKLYLDYNEIGQNIRAARKSKKLTQARVAKECGLSSEMIYYYEHGKKRPSLEAMLNICRICNITLDKLVKIHYEGESQ